MPTYTATDYEPVPPGLYTAKLEVIEKAKSLYGIYYPWVFVIEDEGEFKGRRVRANVSDKFGPQSKARRWCEQMIVYLDTKLYLDTKQLFVNAEGGL